MPNFDHFHLDPPLNPLPPAKYTPQGGEIFNPQSIYLNKLGMSLFDKLFFHSLIYKYKGEG
jgi:hypothetical protein